LRRAFLSSGAATPLIPSVTTRAH